MKLEKLFEEHQEEITPLDYLMLDSLLVYDFLGLRTDYLRECKKNNVAVNNVAFGKKFLKSLPPNKHEEFLSDNDFLNDISVVGNTISSTHSLFISSYDTMGPPPFKIDTVPRKFEITGNCKLMTEFPKWAPHKSGIIRIYGAGFESLHDIHKTLHECGKIVFIRVPIKSHILGLLKIKGLTEVELDIPQAIIDAHPIDGAYNTLNEIINKYLPEGDILDCQEELIDAGFEEYAQL